MLLSLIETLCIKVVFVGDIKSYFMFIEIYFFREPFYTPVPQKELPVFKFPLFNYMTGSLLFGKKKGQVAPGPCFLKSRLGIECFSAIAKYIVCR